MTSPSMRPLETALVDLFQHLGIGRAHFAAGQLVPTDWIGLAARYPERIASLTLVSPRVRRPELESLGPRLMVLAGDAGPSGQGSARLLAELTQAQSLVLRDYECLPWSDLVADRGTEIVAGWLRFLDGLPLPALALPDGEGEAAGISYRIRGSGPPLVLMPLDLAPAQWEPLIAELVPRYSTITLGGPLVGAVALLESRGRSNYLAAIRALLDLVAIEPGETVLVDDDDGVGRRRELDEGFGGAGVFRGVGEAFRDDVVDGRFDRFGKAGRCSSGDLDQEWGAVGE